MTQPTQEPITLTERQAFTMLKDALTSGTYPGDKVIKAAEAIIFCERVIQNAPELSPLTPTKSEPAQTLGPDGLKVAPVG